MTVLFMQCQVLPPFLLSELFSWLNVVPLTVNTAENLADEGQRYAASIAPVSVWQLCCYDLHLSPTNPLFSFSNVLS